MLIIHCLRFVISAKRPAFHAEGREYDFCQVWSLFKEPKVYKFVQIDVSSFPIFHCFMTKGGLLQLFAVGHQSSRWFRGPVCSLRYHRGIIASCIAMFLRNEISL